MPIAGLSPGWRPRVSIEALLKMTEDAEAKMDGKLRITEEMYKAKELREQRARIASRVRSVEPDEPIWAINQQVFIRWAVQVVSRSLRARGSLI